MHHIAITIFVVGTYLFVGQIGIQAAQEKVDDSREAVERAVLDYVTAVYECRPDLIKRSVDTSLDKFGFWRPKGEPDFQPGSAMTFDQLHKLASNYNKNKHIAKNAPKSVVVFDVMEKVASAKLTASWGTDYFHLIKRDGKWKIRHVVWQSSGPNDAIAEKKLDEKKGQQERLKSKIELRLVEKKRIDGITENKGIPKSDDPDDLVYPHLAPAIVLNPGFADVQIKEFEFDTGSGPKTYYMVTLILTEKARAQLAKSIEGDEMRMLTALIDGKFRGVQRYEKNRDKKFVPATASADAFTFNLGMFLSIEEVNRVEAMLD